MAKNTFVAEVILTFIFTFKNAFSLKKSATFPNLLLENQIIDLL